jgi:pimeloyl-ACP methyl ester carboxylesterase
MHPRLAAARYHSAPPRTPAKERKIGALLKKAGELTTAGCSVKTYVPARPSRQAPVVLVHGGGHAKWSFEQHARVLCEGNYEVHALDWLGHGDSARLPEEQFVQRGIDDVAREELSYVVERLGSPPIVIAHSMGAMAALLYAASNPVERLVLLTPVVPSSVGADPIDLDVDLTKPLGLPYDLARLLFFPTLDEDLARMYHALLEPESPRAVWQATRWTLDVDLQAVTAPTLVFATELDILTPPAAVAGLAELMGAPYELIPAIGHSEILLKRPESIAVAERIREWLDRDVAR